MKSTITRLPDVSEACHGVQMSSNTKGISTVSTCIALLAVGLASGWFLRGTWHGPAQAAPPSRLVAASARPATAPAHLGQLAQAWGTASSGKPAANALPQPFHSLEEMAAEMGKFDIFSSEMCILEFMTTLPRLLTTDLPATRRILDELTTAAAPTGEARMTIAGVLLGRWIIQEPETALRYLRAHPELAGHSGTNADGFFDSMNSFGIAMLARRDPAAARAMLPELLPQNRRENFARTLALGEALADPARALAATPPDKLEHANEIAEVWARHEPAAAARWVDSLAEVNDSLVSKVAGAWAEVDQAAAIAWAAGLQSDSSREAAFSAIASSLTDGKEFAEAAEALQVLPPAAAASAILRCAANSYGRDRAAELQAVGEILIRYASDKFMQQAGSHAAGNLAQWLAETTDDAVAMAWMMTLPDCDSRNAAAKALGSHWTGKDAAAASEWVASLPQGDLRASAIAGMLDAVSSTDPERALAWAQSLPPGEDRTERIANLLRGWLPTHPYAAMRAVESLPEELRAEIWKDPE